MKILTLLASFIIIPLVLLATFIRPLTAKADTRTTPNGVENKNLKEILPYLPEGYSTPEDLPAQIEDPRLLAAWIYLYNQHEPIHIHDGIVLTGHSLAQLVLEKSITITWGSEDICGGSSCALRFTCTNLECIQNYTNSEPRIIYVTASLQENTPKNFSYLVKVLAHELYHQTLPFGPVTTSLYEEYWAFYIGTQISKAGWMEFDQYDPLKAVCLQRWFQVYSPEAYDETNLYPFNFQADVDQLSQVCLPAG